MNRLLRRSAWHTALVFLLSCAHDGSPPVPAPVAAPEVNATTQPTGAFVASTDGVSGTPAFLWAADATPAPRGASVEGAARFHLRRLAGAYKARPRLAEDAALVTVNRLDAGARVVVLQQRIGDVDVYPGKVKVVMKANLDLVAIAGSLRSQVATRSFALTPAQALAAALSSHFGASVGAGQIAARGPAEAGYTRLALNAAPAARGGSLRLDEPARVKPVFVYSAAGAALVPAYYVELNGATSAGTSSESYRYVIDATAGKVLERASLTADAAFNYRVWADTTGDRRPADGPQGDYTPHPTGVSDNTDPPFVTPSLVSMDAFNVNPSGTADSWLASGATQTVGNNVDAYTDNTAPNGYSNGDLRATTTGTRAFDRTYDPTRQPGESADQQMASVTQLFYVTNWLHDYYYGSGFDEAAGNAQLSNFGRGGVGGDPLLAEAQDGLLTGSRNNANMSTPADGASPRMQMFVFNGPEERGLVVPSLGITRDNAGVTTPLAFGPHFYDITGEVVLAVDATAPTADGCSALVNDVTGKIVLIDRTSTCSTPVKVKNAQNAGAIGALVANNVGSVEVVNLSGVDPTITIGALGISLGDGNALKAALAAGSVTAELKRDGTPDRDGGIDNMVIAHEWGHYLHHRLADPCGTNQCGGSSEGWGDFTALQMVLREGDDLDGTYGCGVYAPRVFGDSSYAGIRRFPYSVNMARNGLTYRHIVNGATLPDGTRGTSEAHDEGEIWASAMWEVYVALQKRRLEPGASARTFAEVQRRMASYVVAGLQLMPPDATFTEQRDALLAAMLASDADDAAVAAAAFARRGLGSCAVAPPRASTDNAGLVESFEVKPVLGLADVELTDATLACDSDGVLDVGERGRLSVTLVNGSVLASSATDVTVASATPGVVLPMASVHVPALPAFGSVTVDVEVSLDASVTGVQELQFTVGAADPGACVPQVTIAAGVRANTDDRLAASADDDVEADVSAWTASGDPAWARQATAPLAHRWNGSDPGVTADASLVSPTLQVSATAPFVVSFLERYKFETGGTTFFDGGVLELSRDGGSTWIDASTLVPTIGYGGTLAAGGTNPLQGRRAFVNQNATYPAFEAVTLDFGNQLAGESVKLRFRVGSDLNTGAAGWDLDDLHFAGIDNTPFSVVVEDQPSVCPVAPEAHAGDDQIVAGGALVALDASASRDANGDALTYEWTQTAGPAVALSGAHGVVAAFHAPVVAAGESLTLTFAGAVSDGRASGTDETSVVVAGPPPPLPDAGVADAAPPDADVPDAAPSAPDAAPSAPDAAPVTHADAGPSGGGDDDGGCGCTVARRSNGAGGAAGGALSLLALSGLVIARRRRRRV
jgi:hypothetical protein